MARARARIGGFTLVELMVVIVIIGLAASVVVLSMPETGGSLNAEAEAFAARAKASRDGAILEARPAAVRLGPGGYETMRRLDGQWREVASHPWVEGTAAELSGGTNGSIRFDSTGLAEPARVTLARGERRIAIDIGADGNVRLRR
jgi:general secretion pathway protein H